MPRFFVGEPILEDTTTLGSEERHHLVKVYRAKVGDQVSLFASNGEEYEAAVVEILKRSITLKIISRKQPDKKDAPRFILAQALLKNKAWDFVLQKAMELGVDAILPLQTQHVTSGKHVLEREDRWQKVLVAAAKQCGRSQFVELFSPTTFDDACRKDYTVKLIAHNDTSLPTFHEVLKEVPSDFKQLCVMVGPEGGFSSTEVDAAAASGVIPFQMGEFTLRAETAAMSVIANLNFYFST